ncbi:MAG TPA: hypothetical protein DCM02_08555 [Flavobacterium sp.]|nr:hypothetical protein [Flavobacterium sp.]
MDKYNLYALKKAQLKTLEQEILILSLQIGEELLNEKIENKKIDNLGLFVICEKAKWTYSNNVKSLEGEIKRIKTSEQEEGIASKETSQYLRFILEGDSIK